MSAVKSPNKIHLPALTEEQDAILRSVMNGRLKKHVVLAGAGTGKTTLLLSVIQANQESPHNADKHKSGRNILVLSFSKKTADELKGKVHGLENTRVYTLNSFGWRMIRKYHRVLGYKERPDHLSNKAVIKDIDQMLRDEFRYTKDTTERAKVTTDNRRRMRNSLVRAINSGISYSAYADNLDSESNPHADTLLKLYKQLEERLAQTSKATFLHQITGTDKLFEEHPPALESIGQNYHTLLVDEFQDLNEVQLRIVRRLAEYIRNVVVVGDDAQSIYSFRGARSDGLKRFGKWFTVQEHKLTQSHRCTREILALANQVRSEIEDVMEAELVSDKSGPVPRFIRCETNENQDTILRVAIRQLRMKGVKRKEITVLARSNLSLMELHRILENNQIPALLGNRDVLERVCTGTKLLLRVMDGDVSAIPELLELLDLESGDDNIKLVSDKVVKKGSSVSYLVDRLKLIRPKRRDRTVHLEEKLNHVNDCLKYYCTELNQKHIKSHINQLKSAVGKLETSGHVDLEKILDVIDGYENEHDQCLSLQTIHNAKGLEYEAVIVADMVDGLFPDKRSLDDEGKLNEERRLLYVAITRAKKYLLLLNSRYRKENIHAKRSLLVTSCSLLTDEVKEHCKVRSYRDLKRKKPTSG